MAIVAKISALHDRDVNGSDTDGYYWYCVLHLFSRFLSNSDLIWLDSYKYECRLLWLRMQIDVYRIRGEPDLNNVKHGYFFKY